MTQGRERRRRRFGTFVCQCVLAAAFLLAGPSSVGLGAASTPIAWTLVGTGAQADSPDGAQGRETAIDQPRSLFQTPDGGFVWAEPWSNRVRKLWPDGHVSTIAGTGVAGYTGNGGPATQAELNFVHSAAPTSDGGYLIADTQNCVIRRISPAGIISTVAGTGTCGYSGDGGPATLAKINNPRGVAPLPDGGFIFPDSNNQRVRRVAPDGTITTVAGTGVQGFSGDGGPATQARFSIPFAVAPTPDGGFLVIDAQNQRVRKVSSTGIVTTVAGNGTGGYAGDGGPATVAELNNPHNLAVEPDGSFLIADCSNNRIRMVSAGGTITTIFGTGPASYGGDGGPATSAQLNCPKAVAATSGGDVAVSDEQNDRIRFAGTIVAPSNLGLPGVTGTAAVGQTLSGSSGTWSGTGPTFSYQWRRCDSGGGSCSDIGGATAATYTVVDADRGSTLRLKVTASNPAGSPSATSAQTGVVAGQGSSGTLTVSLASGADDGEVDLSGAQSAGYPPSGTPVVYNGKTLTAGRRLAFGSYGVYVPLLRFDTSGLPAGATVTSATLKLYVNKRLSQDGRSLVAEWAPSAVWPLASSDWTLSSSGNALAGVAISSLPSSGVASLSLAGLANVSTTGYTSLRLHVDGGQPSGDNYVQFAASEDAAVADPQLVLNWTTS